MAGFAGRQTQKPASVVPAWIPIGIALGLGLQIFSHRLQPAPLHASTPLPVPPPIAELRLVGLDDPIAIAKVLLLWLQAYDNQPGISIPFRDLDFTALTGWLRTIQELDPQAQYPLLAASHLYAETPVPAKQRQMLEFVYEQFLLAPDKRWPWLAHATYIARHRLHDLPLALRYARALANHATDPAVPHWVQQIQIFVLEDLGELASARQLLQALLQSGRITDPHELQFLQLRLQALEQHIPPA